VPKNLLAVHGYLARLDERTNYPWLSPTAEAVCRYVYRRGGSFDTILFLGGIDHPSLAPVMMIGRAMKERCIELGVSREKMLTWDNVGPEGFRPPCDTAEEGVFLHDFLGRQTQKPIIYGGAVTEWVRRVERIYKALGIDYKRVIDIGAPVPSELRRSLNIANILSIIDPLGEGRITGFLFRANRNKRGAALQCPELVPLIP
jgi:hypothetical protein